MHKSDCEGKVEWVYPAEMQRALEREVKEETGLIEIRLTISNPVIIGYFFSFPQEYQVERKTCLFQKVVVVF